MSGTGLLVIGDVVTDVVALHGSPVMAGSDTAAEIVLRPGGSGANTAAWAAHLGADSRLL
ncbi:MAG: sugar kinase, partial [Nonomuraea sp.]|nr:sugar kinase [Nonomuraea sp.]